ncbi:MAG: hypothetical protein ACJ8EB_03140 [Allosphingosinicella sp.]
MRYVLQVHAWVDPQGKIEAPRVPARRVLSTNFTRESEADRRILSRAPGIDATISAASEPVGFDLSRVPACGARADQSGLVGGWRAGPVQAKDDDPLSTIAGGGPRAAGAQGDHQKGTHQPALPTLSKKTAAPLSTGPCGTFEWAINWKLDRSAPTGGFIVQKVTLAVDVESCPAQGAAPSPVNISVTYWEAWKVNKGRKVTAQAKSGAKADDVFARKPKPHMLASKGSTSLTGEARYHDGLDIAKYGFAATGTAPAYQLPMTWTDPGLSGGSNAVAHTLVASWDCCAAGKDASTATAVSTE